MEPDVLVGLFGWRTPRSPTRTSGSTANWLRRGATLFWVVAGLSLARAAAPAPLPASWMRLAGEGFSGAVLVARGDRVVLREAAGFADAAAGERNRPETVFRIGSVTKTFTATLTLALAAREGWSLDEPLGRRWPELPAAWRTLTPHRLLCHQAGIAELTAEPDFDRADGPARAIDRLRQRLGERPLVFAPGVRTAYSNSNYILLGAWLEHVTGRGYFEQLREQVLAPAGLTHTALATKSNHATGYTADAAAWTPAAERDPGLLDAAGALVANVDDLWSFWRALRDGKILAAPERAKLFAPQSAEFAYGWRRRVALGRELVFQTGYVRGFSAVMLYSERDDVFAVVLANRETHAASTVALELLAAEMEKR